MSVTRRRFIRDAVWGAGYFLFRTNPVSGFEAKEKPNILFLLADDQCHEALSAFGAEVRTPNLDRLVAEGVTFVHAYNQGSWHGAVCIPSRTMFNTGRFLWHAKTVEEKLDREAEAGRLWSQYLARAGYDTYLSGKWHVRTEPGRIFGTVGTVRGGMPEQTEAGYDRPKSVDDHRNGWQPWDKRHGGYWEGGRHWSEILGDEGVGFLRHASESGRPFFMYLAFNAPHDPRQSPKAYVDGYPLEKVKVPENFLPEYPYKDEIGCSKDLRDERLAPFPRTEYAVKVNRREYYAIITHMDAQIGRILEALEKSGRKDNTFVFFTADHGLAVGHHGLMGKQNLFEHSVRAPLLISGPGLPHGKRILSPVYIQDIMPTTLEIAGVAKPDHVQFKSLIPLISGKKSKSYSAIYGGYRDLQRMVREDDFKLIYYPKIDKTLLYDLKSDPHEMYDLAAEPRHAARLARLRMVLRQLQKEVGDPLHIDG